MKIHSPERHEEAQMRLTLDKKVLTKLERYVAYMNENEGHTFADVKELSIEILRACVDADRGFKAWCSVHEASSNGKKHA